MKEFEADIRLALIVVIGGLGVVCLVIGLWVAITDDHRLLLPYGSALAVYVAYLLAKERAA